MFPKQVVVALAALVCRVAVLAKPGHRSRALCLTIPDALSQEVSSQGFYRRGVGHVDQEMLHGDAVSLQNGRFGHSRLVVDLGYHNDHARFQTPGQLPALQIVALSMAWNLAVTAKHAKVFQLKWTAPTCSCYPVSVVRTMGASEDLVWEQIYPSPVLVEME